MDGNTLIFLSLISFIAIIGILVSVRKTTTNKSNRVVSTFDELEKQVKPKKDKKKTRELKLLNDDIGVGKLPV
jgi:hypothetical protein